jgi:hypothetical protein
MVGSAGVMEKKSGLDEETLRVIESVLRVSKPYDDLYVAKSKARRFVAAKRRRRRIPSRAKRRA